MILAIIDMQPGENGFDAANNLGLQLSIIEVIQKYRRHNWPIIKVEYDGFSQTAHRIRRALAGYDQVCKVVKSTDDGSCEIDDAIGENKWYRHSKIELVGVNTNACVRDTAFGLIDKGYNATLIPGCCADHMSWMDKTEVNSSRDIRSLNRRLQGVH